MISAHILFVSLSNFDRIPLRNHHSNAEFRIILFARNSNSHKVQRVSESRRWIVGVVLLILLSSGFAGLFLYLNTNPDRLAINFIPEHTNSSPGEIGWFLVEIDAVDEISTYDIAIQTNVSIETDYKYWPQTPLMEVFVYPNSSHIDMCIEVEVSFTSGELVAHDTAYLYVLNWTFEGVSEVIEKRDVFIHYLETTYPELGINSSTSWTPIHNGVGILIVGHYLFKSTNWEMEIAWHVMIAPHDWVEIYLRPRAEIQPSWAGKIDSWSTDNQTVLEMEPPSEIYRAT